jgi:hypothetical protein
MQQMKKVIVMTTISVGIILLDCALPVLVILMMFNIKVTASCMDYGCANAMYARRCVYQTSSSSDGSSSNMIDSWSRPNGCRASVHDGSFDGGARMSAFASHITLNKAWLHIG